MSPAEDRPRTVSRRTTGDPARLRRNVFAYAGAIVVLGWALTAWQVVADRRATLRVSSAQLSTIATALSLHLEAMINDGVGAAAAGANVVRGARGPAASTEAFRQDVLDEMLTGGRYVRALFLVVGDRIVVDWADDQPVIDLAALPAELRATPGDTHVGRPVRGEPGELGLRVPVARRVADIDGQPAWAGALLGWQSLAAMYERLALDRGAVMIIAEPGVALVRLPVQEGKPFAGMDLSDVQAWRMYRSRPIDSASFEAPDHFSGEPRQFTAQRVLGYPLLAVSSRTVEAALAPWRARSAAVLQTTIACTTLILLLTAGLYRMTARRYREIVRSEQRFELAMASTNDGIWEWEVSTGEVYLSKRLLELLGRSERDPPLRHAAAFRVLVHPDDLARAEESLRDHLTRRTPADLECRLLTASGYRWFRARGQAAWDAQGRPVRMAGSVSDIHDARLGAEALERARQAEIESRRMFARQLILGQELERKRLAGDLHDSVGQNLSLIRNRAVLLARMDLQPQARQQVEMLETLAKDAIDEVRSVVQGLRPLHIDEMGVTDALEVLVERLQGLSGMNVTARIEDIDDAVSGEAATHVYRIVQEAVNNVLKHARARTLRIGVERDIHCVRLEIADDGVGFDPRADGGPEGLGLHGLRERCGILGASLDIQSARGAGTRLVAEIPVPVALVSSAGIPA